MVEVLLLIFVGLSTVALIGYLQGYLREKWIVEDLPADLIVAFLLMGAAVILQGHAPSLWRYFAVASAAAFGCWVHAIAVGVGSKHGFEE